MVGLLKYEFDNKLLVVVTFFRVTLGVTWTQPIFHNLMLILTNLPLDYIIFIYFSCLQNFKILHKIWVYNQRENYIQLA